MQRTCRRLTRRTRPDVLIESISSRTRTTQRQQMLQVQVSDRLNTRTSFEPDDFDFATPWISLKRPPDPTTALHTVPRILANLDVIFILPQYRYECQPAKIPGPPAHYVTGDAVPPFPATVDSLLCIWCRRASLLFSSQPASLVAERYM